MRLYFSPAAGEGGFVISKLLSSLAYILVYPVIGLAAVSSRVRAAVLS